MHKEANPGRQQSMRTRALPCMHDALKLSGALTSMNALDLGAFLQSLEDLQARSPSLYQRREVQGVLRGVQRAVDQARQDAQADVARGGGDGGGAEAQAAADQAAQAVLVSPKLQSLKVVLIEHFVEAQGKVSDTHPAIYHAPPKSTADFGNKESRPIPAFAG